MPLHLANASLKPGDVLRLRIWREPDWSGDYQVDENGMAVLPRLGATVVAAVPADQLRRQLVEQYRQFLNNPSVEIIPLRRVAVVGAVRNPGVYTIDPSVTLGQVANVAGGPTPEAKRNQIELQRAGNRQRVDLNDHPELAGLMLESGDRVYLPERSWLSRNATWFVSTLVGAAGTTAYLLTR
jgi:polysaccharide export outer membrane protein